MPIKLNGATSGSVELDVPAAVGSDLQLTLPATAGEVIVKEADGSVDLGSVDIDSSGNVGIGTSSSPYVLTADELNLSVGTATGHATIQLYSGTNKWGAISFNDNATDGSNAGFIGYYHPNNYMVFNTNNTERMRIQNDGYVRVSTDISDSQFYDSAGSYHVIHQGTSGNVICLVEHSGDTSPSGILINFSDASPDNNTSYFLTGQDSGTQRVRIWSDGDLDNHDNSYGGMSDEKLKQDIADAGSQWDDLKDLRVCKFKFKSDVATYGDEAKTLIGLVAQEVETVSPGLVKNSPDLDEDGNDLGTVTKSVRYSVLYMKAVKALQEAMERIETLETQNASLEARLTALEGGA